MTKCTRCQKNECTYKIFTECHSCLSVSLSEIWGELAKEAFPEINGLPPKEPINPYAKLMRDMADDK